MSCQAAGGGLVGALAAPDEVDLVQLQELSQILNVTSLPPGLYTAADVTFSGLRSRVGAASPCP